MLSSVLAAVLAFFGGIVPAAPELTQEPPTVATATVEWVIDGDTIEVELNGERERVRYLGIDAPEAAYDGTVAECYADAATARNRDLVADETVRLVADTTNRDKYGRLLRYVYAGETFVNEQLLADGAAEVMAIPPDTEHYGAFLDVERAARARGAGLWEACS